IKKAEQSISANKAAILKAAEEAKLAQLAKEAEEKAAAELEAKYAKLPKSVRPSVVKFEEDAKRDRSVYAKAVELRKNFSVPTWEPEAWSPKWAKRKRDRVGAEPAPELLSRSAREAARRRGGFSYAGDGSQIEKMDV